MVRREEMHGEHDQALIKNVMKTVKKIASDGPFDVSHDFSHVERVLSLTDALTASEKQQHPEIQLNTFIIKLTVLLHDIGDRKYPLDSVGKDVASTPTTTPSSILRAYFASESLASTIQLLVDNVSFENEQEHPEEVKELLADYPELAIVQDADRIDALGAMGVARAFAFNGARGAPLTAARGILDTYLLPREKAIKTILGKQMAAERCDFFREFIAHWDLEESGHDLDVISTVMTWQLEENESGVDMGSDFLN